MFGPCTEHLRLGRTVGTDAGNIPQDPTESDHRGYACDSRLLHWRANARPARFRDHRDHRVSMTAAAPPDRYEHVVWIVMENHSFDDIIGSSDAPYINQLAAQYGLATDFHAETHPSLPNYIAMTSGSTQGIADDDPPADHALDVPSIFSLLPAGGSRSLQESMPSNCRQTDSGQYAVRHNPQAYYVNLGGDCGRYNVPLGDSPDVSARFTFITPNLVHDMHDGTVADGDSWLSTFVPKLLSTPEYSAGRTALLLTWDEGTLFDNQIPTLVIAPSVAPGTRVSERLDHYAMLRATQEMLGLEPLLGSAASATDMRTPFNL